MGLPHICVAESIVFVQANLMPKVKNTLDVVNYFFVEHRSNDATGFQRFFSRPQPRFSAKVDDRTHGTQG